MGRLPAKTKTIQMEARLAGPLFMLSAAILFTLMSSIIKLMPDGYTIWHI